MPEGVLYVGRPSKWGNPYWDIKRYGLELCLEMFENTAQGIWNPTVIPRGPHYESWLRWLYNYHVEWTARISGHPLEVIRRELRGKDLACWCPPVDKDNRPVRCHADILLRLANQ